MINCVKNEQFKKQKLIVSVTFVVKERLCQQR